MMTGNVFDNRPLSPTDPNVRIFARHYLASMKLFWKDVLRRESQ